MPTQHTKNDHINALNSFEIYINIPETYWTSKWIRCGIYLQAVTYHKLNISLPKKSDFDMRVASYYH